jgi:hypothetical protein
MPDNPEIRVISANDIVQDVLESEIDRLGARLPLVSPRITRSSSLKHARDHIGKVQPTLVVLDPETPPSKDGTQSSRDMPAALIDGIGVKAPILVALTHSEQGWARETIRRPGLLVWNWENQTNENNKNDSCTLEHLLPLILKPSKERRLRAVIRLGLRQPICDIDIGDAALFRDLPLDVEELYRRDWRTETQQVQGLFDADNRITSWTFLAMTGKTLFTAIFDKLGAALVDARNNGTTLNLRFEIDRDEVDQLFSMPVELLNHEAKWEGFFCRTTAMARRVTPRSAHERREPSERPVLLFVDASATRGAMDVVNQKGEVESRFFRDLSGAVAAEQEELERLQDFCRLEVLKPEDKTSLKDALRKRLADTTKPPPDIIHFTGHAISPEYGSTELILPSSRMGAVDRLSVEVFASWLPAQVQLVVLSACQGVSADTARRLHAAKDIAVLGFRWEVQASAAAEFVTNFYKARLELRESVANAYKAACFLGNAANSAWAAAVLHDHD